MEILTPAQQDELRDYLWEQAYITACELDSPNSYDFEKLCEDIYQQSIDEHADKLY